jgi:hypothetical protein
LKRRKEESGEEKREKNKMYFPHKGNAHFNFLPIQGCNSSKINKYLLPEFKKTKYMVR